MTEVEEVAKATAEASKFGTKALETTEKLGKFVAKVFKEPIKDAVGIIGDRLKFMRWERQVQLADRVEEILSERKVRNTRAVPPKLALPILENASLEESDELQELWAKLLANSMDPSFTEEIRYTYVEIIKSLTSLDVKILYTVYILLCDEKVDWDNIDKHPITKEKIFNELSTSREDYELSVYNLFRVQCLTSDVVSEYVVVTRSEYRSEKVTDRVIMTPLGKYFVEACIK